MAATLLAAAATGCRGCGGDDDGDDVVLQEPPDEDFEELTDDGEPPGRRGRVVRLSRSEAQARVWRKSTRDLAYAGPSSAEARRMEDLVEEVLGLPAPRKADRELRTRARRLARSLDLDVSGWRVGRSEFWAVSEPDDARRGTGTYVVRPGRRRRPVLIQAPHSYFEKHTATIAGDLFFGRSGRAFDGLFANSLHRYQNEPGERIQADDSPADVCHNPEHWFTFATDTVARRYERTTVVQLHGFAVTSEDQANGVYAIVSGGLRDRATPLATALVEELHARFGRGALLYPDEADRLGGTKNAQAVAILERRGARFLHVELGLEFRERLATSRDDMNAFADALVTALEAGGATNR